MGLNLCPGAAAGRNQIMNQIMERIAETGIIPVVKVDSPEQGVRIMNA